MATDLAKVYISKITSMIFYDKDTGEVLDRWDSEKCNNLNVEMEVINSCYNPTEKKIVCVDIPE